MKLTIKIMTIKGCRFEISFGEGLPKRGKRKTNFNCICAQKVLDHCFHECRLNPILNEDRQKC